MQIAINFTEIVNNAWLAYDDSREIKSIEDISVKVSTNHVYRIRLADGGIVIAKLSYFGKYAHFVQDHSIINALANNLPAPFENFLAKSLTKGGQLFTYRHTDELLDAWVVFYNPIQIDRKPAKKQNMDQIALMGSELAHFHKACKTVKNTLPNQYKQTANDIQHLLEILNTETGQFEYRGHIDEIKRQSDLFFENCDLLDTSKLESIPVFVDWNIGNFSVTKDYRMFSRWDYDWFRMSSRMMDFYFFSRVCAAAGDKKIFSYLIDPLMEDRFLIFLKNYHAVYPLTVSEILLLKETYRFFILNYVIKDGRYFFHEIYASRLQREAFDIYFPQLETTFGVDKILRVLNL